MDHSSRLLRRSTLGTLWSTSVMVVLEKELSLLYILAVLKFCAQLALLISCGGIGKLLRLHYGIQHTVHFLVQNPNVTQPLEESAFFHSVYFRRGWELRCSQGRILHSCIHQHVHLLLIVIMNVLSLQWPC